MLVNRVVLQNVAVLQDALHCTDWEDVIGVPRTNNRQVTKKQVAEMCERISFGRGLLVGLVAGLMANGASFDDAWQLCLKLKADIHVDCIPEGWPTARDYASTDGAADRWTIADQK